jgi:mlo protein
LVGTKLEVVIMEMAHEIRDKATVIKGAPAVEPSDRFFWFNRPGWVLFLIHLTLFQNAFQMAHFVWTLVGFLAFPLFKDPRLFCSSSHCSRMSRG